MSDSVVRLSPTLTSPTFFTPNDWSANWCGPDEDLGSATPVLISPSLMFTSGKYGGGFLLDPTNLGGVDGQLFPTPKPAAYVHADVCFGDRSNATFGSFAYAAPFVYVECEGHGLVALNVDVSTPSFTPCGSTCPTPNWTTGGTRTYGPPIVAGGAVWVANDGTGLTAYNATTGALIYQSAGFGINRFSTPSEAGGQVFVASHRVIRSFTFATPVPRAYTAVTPNRLLDTRTSGGPLGPGGSRNLTVTGVSAGAVSVVMNVTVTNTTASSFLTVYPAGGGRPPASNLNWTSGKTIANLVEVPLSFWRRCDLLQRGRLGRCRGRPRGLFRHAQRHRRAARRFDAGAHHRHPPGKRAAERQRHSRRPGALSTSRSPARDWSRSTGVSAAILNVTVTNTTARSFLTVWPAGVTRPTASNLNWVAGQTVPNRVIVPVGTGGKVTVYNSMGAADVIVDVSGYFTDSTATGTLFISTRSAPHR